MHLPTSSLLMALTTIILLPPSTTALPQASGPLSCDNGGPANIQASDWQNAINILNAGGPIPGISDPIPLASGANGVGGVFGNGQDGKRSIDLGSFQVTVENPFVFVGTHVYFSHLGAALQTMKDQCCGVFDSCIGGNTNVLGDKGSAVTVTVRGR